MIFGNLWERRKNRLCNSFDKRLGKYFVKHYSKIQQNYNFIFLYGKWAVCFCKIFDALWFKSSSFSKRWRTAL